MSKKDESLRAAFNEAYASLNAAQREAVDTIEGPVMVIAGPGTGKTQVLTLRIANILLKTQMQPSNILALTFTDAGAKAMRERLHRYVGAEAYQVAIYTFHAFAQKLIRDYPDSYKRVIGGRPASDLDTVSIIEGILEDSKYKLLRPNGNPSYYVSPIKRIISNLKKEYVTPDVFSNIITTQEQKLEGVEKIHQKGAHKGKVRGEYTKMEKSINKNRELLSVYRLYESTLSDKKLYDFEDMIVETVKALQSDEEMLRDLQENYQYILADEHQDVNGSQNKILELLSNFHDNPNIFVVGDEKQAIYRFQGASLENFLHFEKLFSNTVKISLTENYRSGQSILDCSHSLIKVDEGPLLELRVPLFAKKIKESKVSKIVFSHQAVEDSWLKNEILSLLDKGVQPTEIAIIVHTNKEVEAYAGLLRKEGVVVEATADGDILDHPVTHAIESFIKAVVEGHNQESLFNLLHGPYWGISINDLIKVTSAQSYGNSLVQIISSPKTLNDLGVENPESVLNVSRTLEMGRKLQLLEAPHRILEKLLQESGFLDFMLSQDPIEGARVVRRVYDEIEKIVLFDKKTTLKEVSDIFESYRTHRISLTAPYIANNTNSVQIMTAHKSKGLEFECVFVPHLVDSSWDGSSKREYFQIPITSSPKDSDQAIEDEKRLLYVAMTRAKKNLYLSYSGQNNEGKELIASRFFDSVDESTVTLLSSGSFEESFDVIDVIKKNMKPISLDADLFRSYLSKRGLSATSLNNYLRSPYDYLYRNILRKPEVQALPMQFGTAVHSVMEWVSGHFTKTGKMPTATALKSSLETALSRLPITQQEFVRLHEKGFEALLAYNNHIAGSLQTDSQVEFSLKVVLQTGIIDFPEITLTGKLDRLDFDKEGILMRVVDYKTGKPKTRNVIEGKTKSSDGDYKRQLTFYALMLSLYEDVRYQCKTGVLSFVEPDEKGVIHEEVFEITDEEINTLKQEIISAVKEIISGEFLRTPCDDSKSSYCHLASQLIR